MITDLLILRRLSVGIVSFTGFLVLILGAIMILTSLYSDPPSDVQWNLTAAAIATDNPSQVNNTVIMASRDPAAQTTPAAIEAKSTHSETVETFLLGCLKDGLQLKHKSHANQIRVKGQLCNGMLPRLQSSEILNRTNGFQATLFQLESGEVSSDFISLSEGENQIWVQVLAENGEKFLTSLVILKQKEAL